MCAIEKLDQLGIGDLARVELYSDAFSMPSLPGAYGLVAGRLHFAADISDIGLDSFALVIFHEYCGKYVNTRVSCIGGFAMW
jgi:hypothetical protein